MADIQNWQPHARRLAQHLTETGALRDARWWAAFTETPRHLFVPAFQRAVADPAAGPVVTSVVTSAGADDRHAWLEDVYADEALLTQHAATRDGSVTGIPISSSSWPSAMAVMLDCLHLDDDATVLEIGTGTGYNAALLCHRLGGHNITSVDLDPRLISSARDRLAILGHHPHLFTVDGAMGVPETAPFDAIIATCAVATIPPAWITQLKPGGRIVTPFGSNAGALLTLTKTEPDVAQGTFEEFRAYFMPLRPHLDDPTGPLDLIGLPAVDTPVPHEGVTDLDPRTILDPDFELWLELHLAPYTEALTEPDDYEGESLLLTTVGGYARVPTAPRPEGGHLVRQYGRRRPWDTVEAAWRTWNLLGRPARTRIGVWASIDPDQQYLWLDTPTSDFCWPMPAYGPPRTV